VLTNISSIATCRTDLEFREPRFWTRGYVIDFKVGKNSGEPWKCSKQLSRDFFSSASTIFAIFNQSSKV
jgi:hypothetical protein